MRAEMRFCRMSFLAVIAALPSIGAAAPTKTFESFYGWSIQYPSNWTVSTAEEEELDLKDNNYIQFKGPRGCREIGIEADCARVYVTVVPKKWRETLQEHLNLRYRSSKDSERVLLGERKLKVAGRDAVELILKYPVRSRPQGLVVWRVVLQATEDEFLYIEYREEKQAALPLSKWKPGAVIEEMLNSFRLTKRKNWETPFLDRLGVTFQTPSGIDVSFVAVRLFSAHLRSEGCTWSINWGGWGVPMKTIPPAKQAESLADNFVARLRTPLDNGLTPKYPPPERKDATYLDLNGARGTKVPWIRDDDGKRVITTQFVVPNPPSNGGDVLDATLEEGEFDSCFKILQQSLKWKTGK
jgi:hypothetical protein